LNSKLRKRTGIPMMNTIVAGIPAKMTYIPHVPPASHVMVKSTVRYIVPPTWVEGEIGIKLCE
jgi:hypothetical protein